jgi:mycothiol system anti-sigma-R factor
MNTPDMKNMKQDCPNKQECLQLLQSILDGEATVQQKDQFMKQHLEECMPCYKNYHLEVAIRDLIKKNCSCEEAPEELIHSIKEKVIKNLTY